MRVCVTGASSQIGHFLLPLLIAEGHQCVCVSRQIRQSMDGVQWIEGDLEDRHLFEAVGQVDVWIHLAKLHFAPQHLPAAISQGMCRFIAFSSTSLFTKQASDCPEEQQFIRQLAQAEADVAAISGAHGVAWTLFRPTMIYGCGNDKNVTFIRSVIAKFGFFPVAGAACGLRQPVHAADLASACVGVLDCPQAYDKSYHLSGAEVLSYRAMVERIFTALGRQPRIISLPAPLYKLAIIVLRTLFFCYRFVQTAMVDRMNMDMAFDHAQATADFGYHPRPFQPSFE